MKTSAIMCPQCRRVIALGASLPAECSGLLIPTLPDQPVTPHHDCVELDVDVPDELGGTDALAWVERSYAEQLNALAELAPNLKPER